MYYASRSLPLPRDSDHRAWESGQRPGVKGRLADFVQCRLNCWQPRPARAENGPVDEDTEHAAEEPAGHVMAQLVSGVGQVCISASALEWALTYLTGVIAGWEDPEYARVLGRPGQPLREFQKLVPR